MIGDVMGMVWNVMLAIIFPAWFVVELVIDDRRWLRVLNVICLVLWVVGYTTPSPRLLNVFHT